MSFGKMTLSMKLALGFGITLTLLVVVAAVGILRLSSVTEDLDQIVNVSNKKVTVANDIIDTANAIQVAVRNLIISEDKSFDEKERASLDQMRPRLVAAVDKLATMLAAKEEKDLFKAMSDSLAGEGN